MLDGHFVVEHIARNRSGRFFNFNGTAGHLAPQPPSSTPAAGSTTRSPRTWTCPTARSCGLAVRLPARRVAPAELPVEMNAFKCQQFRWAKGSVQTAKKLLPTSCARTRTFRAEDRGLLPPDQQLRLPVPGAAGAAAAAEPAVRQRTAARELLLLDVPLFFGTTCHHRITSTSVRRRSRSGRQRVLRRDAVKRLPLMMAVGIGLSSTRRARCSRRCSACDSEFVRTPKHGVRGKLESWTSKKYRAAKTLIPFIEVGLAAYFAGRDGGRLRPATTCRCRSCAVPVRLRLRRRALGVAGLARPVPAPNPSPAAAKWPSRHPPRCPRTTPPRSPAPTSSPSTLPRASRWFASRNLSAGGGSLPPRAPLQIFWGE